MTHIFLLHAIEDYTCASRIRQDLNVRGYAVDDEIQTLDVSAMLYIPSAKSALVASAAVILLWSSYAARNERVWNAVRFAQQLKRPILPVTLDSTAFPETLPGAVPTLAQLPCDTIAASLTSSLPSAQSNDDLFTLYEQAVDMAQPVRVEAIERAATMLQSTQHRSGQAHDALLALLTCLAQDDTITSVREKAQAVLNAQTFNVPAILGTPSGTSTAKPQLFDKGTFYEYVCSKGHTTSIDKNMLHQPNSQLMRRGVAVLTCKICGEQAKFKM